MSENPAYVDHWQEYKAISNKLKKRFSLRKPNVPEASSLFGSLATRLQDDHCLHYAGFCHLSVARCEHSVGNYINEKKGLVYAARLFADAEMMNRSLHLPGLEELLAATSHCYSHAVRVCCEQKQSEVAGALCLEHAVKLVTLGKLGEALNLFKKSAHLSASCFTLHVCALKWLETIYVEICDYNAALNAICQVSAQLVRRISVASQIYMQSLAECELAFVLVMFLYPVYKVGSNSITLESLFCMKPVDEGQSWSSLAVGSSQPSTPGMPPFLSQTFLDADMRICLQSLALAVETKNRIAAKELLDIIWKDLKSVHKTLLLRIIRIV